ncbi:MAG: protein-L-isoaspartate(D-aspartate) O-methyltransferase [Gammaproteobacteria bacterium]|nr:protein-L-isoaspartate(D-aspartate) O-methyltransferase [Gammaproteobacteria bacterium]
MPFLVSAANDYAEARRRMVMEIRADVRATSTEIGKSDLSERVMEAMATVPRHEFVPSNVRKYAYVNRPLPIGYGQTISQPYIVALMTDVVNLDGNGVVLEIGTGSGYQAALLAKLVKQVFTIEIIEELGQQASERLQRLNYQNITTRIGDGYYGWEQNAPFDAIVVTAAAGYIPPPLIDQLKPGGKMVIPVGSGFMTQYLVLVEKNIDGKITTRELLPVRFVPFTGGH